MRRRLEISGFRGVVSAVDESLVHPSAASDARNVQVEDGRIRLRRGTTSLSSIPGGFTSLVGGIYARGYDDAYAFKEELIEFRNSSGTRKPYSIDLGTGTRTEIKNGTTSLALTDGDWTGLSFNGLALCFMRGSAVYKHQVKDATSWTAVDVSPPASLTGTTTVNFETTEEISGATANDGQIEWTTSVGGDFTDWSAEAYDLHQGGGLPTGYRTTSFDSVDGNTVIINHNSGSSPHATLGAQFSFGFELAVPTGESTDWSASDKFTLPVVRLGGYNSSGQPYNRNGYPVYYYQKFPRVWLKNSGVWTELSVTFTASSTTSGVGNDLVTLTCSLASITCDSVEAIRVAYLTDYDWNGSAWTEPKKIQVRPLQLASVGAPTAITPTTEVERMRFGIAPYDSETGQESADVQASNWFYLDSSPTRYFDDLDTFLGNVPTVILPTPVSPANNQRVYVQFETENVWRLYKTSEEEEEEVALTSTQMKALPARIVMTRTPVGNVLAACAHKGFVVWGTAGGKSNLKLSAVGDPGRLANDLDDIEDLTRGASLTLADDFADSPTGIVSVDSSVYVGGERGFYALSGDLPSAMTPPKRFPGSSGLLGCRAIARWKDEGGNPGCAYIDTSQQLWLAQVVTNVSEFGLRQTRLDLKADGLIRSFLTQTDTPTSAELLVIPDPVRDALWLVYGTRAMVLRRPSLASGEREWELYTYSKTWKRVALDESRGLVGFASDGSVHRLDLGTTDSGTAVPTAYWRSKVFSDVNRRWDTFEVERESMAKPVTLQVVSDRATNSKVLAANKRNIRFYVDQQGWKHYVEIQLSDQTAVVERLVITESIPTGRGLDR